MTREQNQHDPLARLRGLAQELRHVREEHAREGQHGTTRRGLDTKMQRIVARYARLLGHWVADPGLREAWLRHLRDGARAPDEPRFARPPVFRGRTEADTVVEVRRGDDDFYEILHDGAIARREQVPWLLDPDLVEPLQIGEYTCRETFQAPDAAVEALATHLATAGTEPPRAWARALYEDGLIGPDFELTARGHRRLARVAPAAHGRIGVLAVDGSRARIYVLEMTHGESAPTLASLVELAELTSPARRARDAELFSESRPGIRRESPQGPRHGVSDRREGHRRSDMRHFAVDILTETARVLGPMRPLRFVVVASPTMLGILRPLLERDRRGPGAPELRELARDLTGLTPPALHDALAAQHLLPERGRLPPLRPPLPGTPLAP